MDGCLSRVQLGVADILKPSCWLETLNSGCQDPCSRHGVCIQLYHGNASWMSVKRSSVHSLCTYIGLCASETLTLVYYGYAKIMFKWIESGWIFTAPPYSVARHVLWRCVCPSVISCVLSKQNKDQLSRRTCCKHVRWTLSVINLRPS